MLREVSGFDSLVSVRGNVEITENAGLTNIELEPYATEGWEIQGSLTIMQNNLLSEVAVTANRTGSLVISDEAQLRTIEIRLLQTGDISWIRLSHVESIRLPTLTKCQSFVVAADSQVMYSISAPSVEVIRVLQVSESNSNLQSIDFDQLQQAQGIYFGSSFHTNDGLQSIRFPNLRTISDSLHISHYSETQEIYMPALEGVGPGGSIYDSTMIVIRGNLALTSIVMPSLARASSLYIAHNPVLTSVVMESLVHVTSLDIVANTKLMNLDFLSSLAEANVAVPGGHVNARSITIYGNGINCVNWMYIQYSC